MLQLWPKCAKDGCSWPGVFKFEFTDDSGDFLAYVCPLCLIEAPTLFKEIAAVREERRLLEWRQDHSVVERDAN
jgi:hypothetical protein